VSIAQGTKESDEPQHLHRSLILAWLVLELLCDRRDDTAAREGGTLGVWLADLDTSALTAGAALDFTLYYPEEQRWEGKDYRVTVSG
jgi:hypothetical protein